MKKHLWLSSTISPDLENRNVFFLVPRSAYQVLTFEMPRMKATELETSIRYKIRSLTPLHADQYKTFLYTVPQNNKVVVLAFLFTLESYTGLTALSGKKKLHAGFPCTLPSNWPDRLFLSLGTPDGWELYHYVDRVLKQAFPPTKHLSDFESFWTPLRAANQDFSCYAVNTDPEHLAPFELPSDFVEKDFQAFRSYGLLPPLQETLPISKPFALPTFLFFSALLLFAVGALRIENEKTQRNQEWRTWVDSQKTSVQQTSAPISETRWKSLKDLVGLPVVEVFERLAKAWPSGVDVHFFQLKSNHMSLEAEGPNAIRSLEQAIADPWFKKMRAVQIRSLPSGRESFVLEGDLSLEQ